jgi:hypothetical protein
LPAIRSGQLPRLFLIKLKPARKRHSPLTRLKLMTTKRPKRQLLKEPLKTRRKGKLRLKKS